MALRRSFFLRLGLTVIAAIFCANAYRYLGTLYHSLKQPFWGLGQHPSRETLGSLTLTDEQCHATFPGLTKEIDNAVARGPFELKRLADDQPGLVQAKLVDGKVRFSRYIESAILTGNISAICRFSRTTSKPRRAFCMKPCSSYNFKI